MPKHSTQKVLTRTSYLSAELLRSRGSTLHWLPFLSIPLVILTILFASLASASEDAMGILGWQSLFVTGMYAPLITLFAATPEHRETSNRGGGTWWRHLNPRLENAARFAVVLLSLAVFHLLNFGGSWAVVAAQGRTHHELLLEAGLYSFLGAVGLAGLAAACARQVGFTLSLLVGAVWQIISILPGTVEGSSWWAFPPAWPQRLLLRSLRIHQNSVPLEPDDPLLTSSIVPAILGCAILAFLGTAVAIYTPRRHYSILSRRRQTPDSASHIDSTVVATHTWQPTNHPRSSAHTSLLSTMAGLHRAALNPAVVVCLVVSIFILCFLTLIYPADYVEGFFNFFLQPVGAGILPILVWPLLSAAWPLVHTETRYGPTGLLLWLFCVVTAVSVTATLAVICAGGNIPTALAALPLSLGVGYTITAVSLVLVIRFGAASAIAFTVVGTIVSATLGGDVLADTALWILAFPAWPMLADSPVRYALASALTLILSVAASLGARHVFRTHALRQA